MVKQLYKQYNDNYSITCIGPAGDFQLSSASIQTTDLDGRPCRAAGRGGLGAVMGSKGLKALIVEKGAATPAPLASKDDFMAASKAYAKAVKDDEFTSETLTGTWHSSSC